MHKSLRLFLPFLAHTNTISLRESDLYLYWYPESSIQRKPLVKEYVHSSRLDQCTICAIFEERYVNLEIP